MFCMQESAKATLNMKDCQMTDRTTQTEHLGTEVRHKENLSRSVRNTKVHCTKDVPKNASINDVAHYLTVLGYNNSFLKTILSLQYVLDSFSSPENTFYTQSQPLSLLSHHLKSIFHTLPKL